jgi:hypothetical protein
MTHSKLEGMHYLSTFKSIYKSVMTNEQVPRFKLSSSCSSAFPSILSCGGGVARRFSAATSTSSTLLNTEAKLSSSEPVTMDHSYYCILVTFLGAVPNSYQRDQLTVRLMQANNFNVIWSRLVSVIDIFKNCY